MIKGKLFISEKNTTESILDEFCEKTEQLFSQDPFKFISHFYLSKELRNKYIENNYYEEIEENVIFLPTTKINYNYEAKNVMNSYKKTCDLYKLSRDFLYVPKLFYDFIEENVSISIDIFNTDQIKTKAAIDLYSRLSKSNIPFKKHQLEKIIIAESTSEDTHDILNLAKEVPQDFINIKEVSLEELENTYEKIIKLSLNIKGNMVDFLLIKIKVMNTNCSYFIDYDIFCKDIFTKMFTNKIDQNINYFKHLHENILIDTINKYDFPSENEKQMYKDLFISLIATSSC